MTNAYVPEGSLKFLDAVASVAERRFGARALSEREHLALRVAATAGRRAAGVFVVPVTSARIDTPPQDLERRAALTREAARWLRHRLVAGEVKAQFVCEVVGLLDIAPAWWTGRDFDRLARTGRPRLGFLHNGAWFQGHVVVPQSALDVALDRDKAGLPFARDRAPAPNKGGRPKTYDYEWLALEVADIYYNAAKRPATREALIKELQLRYHAKFDRMPDESTMKRFVRKVFARLALDK